MPQLVGAAAIQIGAMAVTDMLRPRHRPSDFWRPVAPVLVTREEDRTDPRAITSRDNGPLAVTTDAGGPEIGVFGAQRVGGRNLFSARSASGDDWLVIGIAGAAVAVSAIYLDDLLITRDGVGVVQTPPWNAGAMRIEIFDGAHTSAPASLVAAFPGWTSQFVGRGLTFAVIRMTKSVNAAAFAAGVPAVSFETPGFATVYDPRTGTVGPSNNAALIAAAYLTHPLGAAMPARYVDWTDCARAADICDEPVALAAGGSEPRYAAALRWLTDERHEDVLARVGRAMGGGVYPAGASYKFAVASLGSTGGEAHITPDWYASDALTFSDFAPIRAAANGARGRFSNPARSGELRDFPAYQDSFARATDGVDLWLDLHLDAVRSHTQAQRLARIALWHARNAAHARAHLTFRAIDVVADDLVRLTDPLAGFDGGLWRVMSDRVSPDWTCELELRSEDAAAYVWDTARELPLPSAPAVTGGGTSGGQQPVTTTGSAAGDVGATQPAGGLVYDASSTAGYYAGALPSSPGAMSANSVRYGPTVATAVSISLSPTVGAAYRARRVYRRIEATYGSSLTLTGITTTTVTEDADAVSLIATFPALAEFWQYVVAAPVSSYRRVTYEIDSISLATSVGGSDRWDTLASALALPAANGLAVGTTPVGTLPTPCAPYPSSGSGLAYTLTTNAVSGAQSSALEWASFDTADTASPSIIGTTATSGAAVNVSGAAGTGKYYRCRTTGGGKTSPWSHACLIIYQ